MTKNDIFDSFKFNFGKYLNRYININKEDIENNSWGFGELTKKKVIGQIIIANKNILLFFVIKKTGIKANKLENCIIPPNCSAPTGIPIDIIISPIETKLLFIGKISLWNDPSLNIPKAPEKW